MKKLLLGIAVCCCISGVNGTDLVSVVVADPTSYHNVSLLVSSIMKDDEEITKAESALKNSARNVECGATGHDRLTIERICCMLYSLSRDLRSYNLSSVDYYVKGARDGLFGPFDN